MPREQALDLVEDRRRDRSFDASARAGRRRARDEHDLVLGRVEADVGPPHVVEDDEVGVFFVEHRALALQPRLAVLGAEGDEHLARRASARRARGRCPPSARARPSSGSSPSAASPRALRRPVVRDRGCEQRTSTSASASAASSIASRGRRRDRLHAGRRGTARFAASRTTSAPRRRASSASATPIRPDERLPRKRTASIGSRVPPAVTSTRLPASVARREQLRRSRARSRPAPPSAHAPLAFGHLAFVRPDQLDAARAQRLDVRLRRRMRPHARVHRRRNEHGPRCASAASVSMLSASPCASFASVFAVHGATTSRSAARQVRVEILVGGPARERPEGLSADEPLRARASRAAHSCPP